MALQWVVLLAVLMVDSKVAHLVERLVVLSAG